MMTGTVPELLIHAGLSRDHLVTVGAEPLYRVPGGPGLYGSLGARLGALAFGSDLDIALVCGIDYPATDFRELFNIAKVDLTHSKLAPIPDVWILNSDFGRKVVLDSTPGAHELEQAVAQIPKLEDPLMILPEMAKAPVVLLSAPVGHVPTAPASQLIAVDPDQFAIAQYGWAYLDQISSYANILLPSRVQLQQIARLCGHDDVLRAARDLQERLQMVVVARLDVEGALILTDSGSSSVPTHPVTLIDSTGAGDSHAGALLGYLAAARSAGVQFSAEVLLAAAKVASAVGALAVSDRGSKALAQKLAHNSFATDHPDSSIVDFQHRKEFI